MNTCLRLLLYTMTETTTKSSRRTTAAAAPPAMSVTVRTIRQQSTPSWDWTRKRNKERHGTSCQSVVLIYPNSRSLQQGVVVCLLSRPITNNPWISILSILFLNDVRSVHGRFSKESKQKLKSLKIRGRTKKFVDDGKTTKDRRWTAHATIYCLQL